MELKIVGIDLAKSVFHLHGVNARGKALLRKRLSRAQLLPFLANLPRCTVAMEACGSAHYWAREIERLGHQARLISPQFVKAFLKSNKNDRHDATGQPSKQFHRKPPANYLMPSSKRRIELI